MRNIVATTKGGQMKTETTYLGTYYRFSETEYEINLEGRFWNCQGKHIAIVAVVTKNIDWAAYIGTDAPDSYTEQATLKYVASKGCKLSEKDARHFFPEIKLPYRP